MLLKAHPRLEDNVAEGKADPSVCLQLKADICLAIFFRNSWLHVLRQAVFVTEVLATAVAWFWQTGKWQVIWCLRRPKKFIILGLCVCLECVFFLTSSG